MALSEPALQLRSVRLRLGGRPVLDGVSLDVARGEVVALLGPNGAGKTTALRVAAGLLRPDAGEVRVDGLPMGPGAAPAKGRLGYAPDLPGYPGALRARAMLRAVARLHGLAGAEAARRAEAVLAEVGLAAAADRALAAYSHGMLKRFALALALLHEPPLLLLDEPSAALDAQGQAWLATLLRGQAADGKAVLLTTHLADEARDVCTRTVALRDGRLADGGKGVSP